MSKGIDALRKMVEVQCSHGNWNYDPYMHGMANGLLLALATMEDREPEYKDAPKKWIASYMAGEGEESP